MNTFLVVLCFLAVPLATASPSWTPEEYPNPFKDVDKCGRKGVSSWVCDPDGVITYDSANVVEGNLKEIYAGNKPYALGPCGTEGLKGYQVAVALMQRMRYTGDVSVAAEQFARKLHDGWGVGDKECNNGVLLFLSVEDRQLYISTGAGTTSRLTYDVLGDIISAVRPALKDKRYNDAVERAVVDIGLALAGHAVEPDQGSSGFNWDEFIGLGIFGGTVALIMLWGARSESRKRKRYQDCKSKLEKLKRDQAAMQTNSYNATSCPVCLEDFTPETAAEGNSASSAGQGATGTPPAASAAAAAAAGDNDAANGAGGSGSGRAYGKKAVQKGEEDEDELRRPLVRGGAGGSSRSGGDTGLELSAAGGVAAADGSTAAPAAADGVVGSAPPAGCTRRPLVLPCGHAFCEPCITKWLDQKKVTCPICRRPFDEDDSPAASDPRDTRPAPPRPGTDPNNPTASAGGGPSSSSGGGPRPPCTVDDEETNGEYGSTAYAYASAPNWNNGNGASGSAGAPRLRLRWGPRRHQALLQDDLLLMEMMFRLRQLQQQHPEYISTGMVNSWEQDMQNGRDLSPLQMREFQLRDPATRQALASSGSSGTSVSFGGGGSGGGGGRGGSW